MDLKILNTIEEQIAVQFTGKVNVLSNFNHQYLGHILFKDGEIFQVEFQQMTGLKAFYQLIIQEFSLNSFSFIVEPEIVEENLRKIHYPYAVLKNKISEVLKQYRSSIKYRPPENIRILINSDFIKANDPVTPEEFKVLEVISEFNRSFDIYHHCQLLDHEITLALVSLRKKGALKIIGNREVNDDSV